MATDADRIRLRLVDLAITAALESTPADKTARARAALIGVTFGPGELVRDTLSGQLATVLYAKADAIRRLTP